MVGMTCVGAAIDSLSNNEAPGEDGLEGEALKAVGSDLAPYLADLSYRVVEEAETPPGLKEDTVVPTLKPGTSPGPTIFAALSNLLTSWPRNKKHLILSARRHFY